MIGTDTALLRNAANWGGLAGSFWAIYPPEEIDFLPGQATALAVVTDVKGRDAVARLEPSGRGVQPGARAIAYAPPPALLRVPVFFRDVPPERREQLAQALGQRLGEMEIVGPGNFARFVVDLEGDTLRLYGADGSSLAGSFALSNMQSVDNAALVMARSVTAAQLLSMENASSRMRLEAKVVAHNSNAESQGTPAVSDLHDSLFRIRRPGESRTRANSLQLEIRVSEDSYLTIVDVDSQGGVNLLFPNPYSQKAGFYPDGKVRGGETMLLPDSLQAANRAGFHWDYEPPAGPDTIRVFACTHLDTAKAIRQYIGGLPQRTTVETRGTASRSAVSRTLEELRTRLARVTTRGQVRVADDMALSNSDWTATSLAVIVAE